jgi:hypothetical protein
LADDLPAGDLPADEPHRRPEGVGDELVEAVGKVSEALEWVERARGRLYDFHQMMGRADLRFGEAAEALATAGASEPAHRLGEEIVGRNVVEGRWTFQIVEEFGDGYWAEARALERAIRGELIEARPHVFESEMREERRTHGRRHHEARPDAVQ